MRKTYVPQKMRKISRWSVVHILFSILSCYTILILSYPHGCSARDNITIKSRLVDGETLVSAGNRFILGFFGPSKSSNVKRYVGIWYTSSPQTVVWVANRENPLPDKSGVLFIADDGNLKLSDEKRNHYWSTELELNRFAKDPVAKLNDTGNLILFDDRLRNIWQSFNHSTDTFLFGMMMGEKFSLTSWTSEEDPTPGKFTFKQDPKGKNQPVVMEKSITYWRPSRPESGKIFKSDAMPSTLVNLLNFSGNTRDYENKRMVMNFTGDLQYWQLGSESKNWSLIWWVPKDKCNKFNFCGNFGICNGNNKLPCKCLPGFKPEVSERWIAGDYSDGCSRNYAPCGNYIFRLKRMKVGNSDSLYDNAKNETDCRQECLRTCKCQAYSFIRDKDSPRDTSSCLIWNELINLQEDQDGGYDLYVRVAQSDIESTVRNCETCGTNLVPYPLSTGPQCGDPLYSNFYCNNDTYQLSFMAPTGNYNVISVNPETRVFVIKMQAEEDKCDGNKILQLSQSSPFNLTC